MFARAAVVAFTPASVGRPKQAESPNNGAARSERVDGPSPPFDIAALHGPLLAHSIELCRRYGYDEHNAEDFLQEMWLSAFKRALQIWAQDPESGRIRTYTYLRRRLLGRYQDHQRGRMRHLVGRPEDDAATLDYIETVRAEPHVSDY